MRRFLVIVCLVGLSAGAVGGAALAAASATGITAKPSKVNFGGVKLGNQKSVAVTLTNNTSDILQYSSSSQSEGFSYADNNACLASIPSGGSCTIGLVFQPAVAGKASGTVSFTFTPPYPNNTTEYTVSIPVSGTSH